MPNLIVEACFVHLFFLELLQINHSEANECLARLFGVATCPLKVMESKIEKSLRKRFGEGLGQHDVGEAVYFVCNLCEENVGYVLEQEKRKVGAEEKLRSQLDGIDFVSFEALAEWIRSVAKGLVVLHRERKELPPGHPYIDFIEEVEVSLAWLQVGRSGRFLTKSVSQTVGNCTEGL